MSTKRVQLMLLVLMLVSVVKAQANQVVKIGFNGSKIVPAFKRIESISELKFIYNREDIDENKRLNIPEKERTIADLLNEVSDQADLSFKIVDGLIAISKKDASPVASALSVGRVDVRGKVTDSKGEPLAGATIKVKGTNIGAATDANGNFVIDAALNSVLVVSYTGFLTKEIPVSGTSLTIALNETETALTEVVVTALGIKKERKALGYSVTEVQGESLTQAREVNVVNSLVGKVAGLNVSSVSGGPGASSNVTIRGISSLSGNNQPLYVVNGVPVINDMAGNNGGQWTNSPDLGDGIQNINPDDIETISVLKGAAASALYGSRAKAGVILITTKNGSGKGTVEFNSNFVAEQIVNPTDFQYVYGQGSNNTKPTTAQQALEAGQSSWGAKLDGSGVIQFDGQSRPFIAQKDNLDKFYRTGGTFTNTLAFGKGFEGGAFRLSASYLDNNSTVPNSGLDRYNFNLSSNFNLTPRLTVDARANYVSDKAKNRPILGDYAGNATFNAMFLPTSIDINSLKPGSTADREELVYSTNKYATNPWFQTEKFINNTLRNRLIGSLSARYTFENGYFAQLRVGRDSYNDRYTGVLPNGTAFYGLAPWHITEQFNSVSELNADVLLGKTFDLGPDFTITPNVGANLRKARSEGTTQTGLNFVVPYTYTILNAANKSIAYTDFRQEVQSVYGTVELAYKGTLYLTGSGRTDWFSTLAPSDDLSIFYPSVSGSFVFSDLLRQKWLSFGKLRAGWANVGGSLTPYQTLLNYGLMAQQLNGRPLGTITNASVPNSLLRPSNASELEIGAEMRLFNNRISLDISWYDKTSKNEILVAPASITSGYNGAVLNIGELKNTGVEMLLSGSPVKNRNFNWQTSFNGSVNNNEVVSLAVGQGSLGIATARPGNGFTQNIVGKAAYQVMAFDYKYDESGNVVLDDNGVPAQGDLKAWGSAYHKLNAGWNNEFSYKNFNLSFLIDGKFGGKIFSSTDYFAYQFGLHKETLVNREGTFGTNLNAQTYYTTLANNVSKLFVEDASFIKFRQVTFGYTFPTNMFNNAIRGATLSFVGRNLFTIMKKTDNIDPESSYGGISQGLELAGVPPVRTYGLNLSLKF